MVLSTHNQDFCFNFAAESQVLIYFKCYIIMKMKIVNESGKSVYEKPQIGIVNLEMQNGVMAASEVNGYQIGNLDSGSHHNHEDIYLDADDNGSSNWSGGVW